MFHQQTKIDLYAKWPTLYSSVRDLAELLDDTWEYNVEELNLETGQRRLASMNWVGNRKQKEDLMVGLDRYEQINIDYGGPRRKEYKIVKRRKPEGYVDA